jgi:hypothetical protein
MPGLMFGSKTVAPTTQIETARLRLKKVNQAAPLNIQQVQTSHSAFKMKPSAAKSMLIESGLIESRAIADGWS